MNCYLFPLIDGVPLKTNLCMLQTISSIVRCHDDFLNSFQQLYSCSLCFSPSLTSIFFTRSDEGLTLETSALQHVTVANLHFQLSWYNQITLWPPPTQHHSFFRNFHPLFICLFHSPSCSPNRFKPVILTSLARHANNVTPLSFDPTELLFLGAEQKDCELLERKC